MQNRAIEGSEGETKLHGGLDEAGHHLHLSEENKQCKICAQQNDAWDELVRREGIHLVATRVNKTKSYKLYDRKYPYDSTAKAIDIEQLYDLGVDADPLDEVMANETRDELYELLTPYQQFITSKTEDGYKPREIAAMLGKENSGSTRWQKHAIKQRLLEYLDED